MANNTAIVGVLSNIQAIPNADKIRSADVTVHGVKQAQVVIGLDEQNGDKVVYFTSNMCIKEPLLDLFPDLGTYLGRMGRVRSIRLRGTVSDGLVVSIDKFQKWEKQAFFQEAVEFTSLGSTEICVRYTPPTKIASQPKAKKDKLIKKFNRLVENQVHLHYDTDNFRRNAYKVGILDRIVVSRKYHGTSSTAQHVLTKRPLTIRDKIAKFFGVPVVETVYDYIYTSRTVVKNATINLGKQNHFYGYDLWTDAGEKYFKGKLLPGEAVYYEIVGYIPTGKEIQKGYTYGCAQNTYKIYVYRITLTTPDGVTLEYAWDNMEERCKELGVETPEVYYKGTLRDLTGFGEDSTPAKVVEYLEQMYLGKKAPDCGNRPDEGIVIRVDRLHQAEAYKLKDADFIIGESKAFEKGDEDMEEGA